jgi:copper/silver efflux system protein
VMKRIAAPMVGGLLTSAFLTLEIIPVIYTYWRQEQVLWERLEPLDAPLLGTLRRWTSVQEAGWLGLVLAGLAAFYVPAPAWAFWALAAASAATVALGTTRYLAARPAARRLVWPAAA